MTRQSARVPLSRQRILDAALTILDAEGLGAISMRRIGQHLGVEAMSLYNHVPNKAAILDGIYETILTRLPPPKRATTWKAALRTRARDLRSLLRAHPRALALFASRGAVTPRSLQHVESTVRVLCSAGMNDTQALSAMQTLLAYVVGHTLATVGERDQEDRSVAPYANLDRDRYPYVGRMVEALSKRDPDKEFQFGLDAMLTGMEAMTAVSG